MKYTIWFGSIFNGRCSTIINMRCSVSIRFPCMDVVDDFVRCLSTPHISLTRESSLCGYVCKSSRVKSRRIHNSAIRHRWLRNGNILIFFFSILCADKTHRNVKVFWHLIPHVHLPPLFQHKQYPQTKDAVRRTHNWSHAIHQSQSCKTRHNHNPSHTHTHTQNARQKTKWILFFSSFARLIEMN